MKNIYSDLSSSFRFRLSNSDMEFLIQLSEERNCTVSDVLRSFISHYRKEMIVHGNTKSIIIDKL